MSDAISLGPLLLPTMLLVVLAAGGATLGVGRWWARRAGEPGVAADLDGALWNALLVGALAARLAFVLEYRALYAAAPLGALDIRDGGWEPAAGVLGAWAYALWRGRRAPPLRRGLRASLAAGTALFVAGLLALTLLDDDGGPALPPLALASLDGRTVRLDAFAGKPTVVNLWATWCPPCVRELPVMRDVQARRPDVHFVFLNQGEEAALVARWLQARGFELQNVLVDERRQAGAAFRQKGYPTTLFFDARGRLVSSRIGEVSAATLAERLEQIAD
jgi:thiol-disulfide isomerase/thioredoxin